MAEDNRPESWLPPGEPSEIPVIHAKERLFVQTQKKVIQLPVDALEYYSRYTYDNVAELRGTVTVAQGAISIQLPFLAKTVWVLCDPASASQLFVNLSGGTATNTAATGGAGSLQFIIGEGRQFWLPIDKISIISDGVGTATWRITFGY